ncbi:MAG: iron-sulfur cluster assembly accessory protein [Bacteroidetes bacterium]|nr:iron-sulfur cluster assembly accessory protein [Fibrella sp.]
MNKLAQPIRIRSDAREQIIDTFKANKIPADYGLRVGIRGGGCGASWLLGFDLPGEADEIYLIDTVRVIIDRKHLLYVLGAEIGFEQNDDGHGFTVEKA